VAQAYVRFATAFNEGQPYQPDFEHAVIRHALIDAIERSDVERAVVRVGGRGVASRA
jgi:predicted dehydrogenase